MQTAQFDEALAGIAGDGHDLDRGMTVAEWLVRTYVPLWLREVGQHKAASRIEALPVATQRDIRDAREWLADLFDAGAVSRAPYAPWSAWGVAWSADASPEAYTPVRIVRAAERAILDAHAQEDELDAAYADALCHEVWRVVTSAVWDLIVPAATKAARKAFWRRVLRLARPDEAREKAKVETVEAIRPSVERAMESAVTFFSGMR